MQSSSEAKKADILVVDDDPDISQALSDFLEHDGYRVHLAETGWAALACSKQRPYSAVILDLGLPDMDGMAVLKKLQEHDPKLPVIILTAFTASERTAGAISQGAFALLTKPYNREQLRGTLGRAIGVKALAARVETVETALSASEDRFRSVVQSASDAIVLADARGTIMLWNKAAERLFLYTEQEAIGESLTHMMPARYREMHEQGLRRLQSSGESRIIGKSVELHGLRKDGSEFPLELSLGTWTVGDNPFYCGIIRDITERKRMEDARAEQLRLATFAVDIGNALTKSPTVPDLLRRCTEAMVHHLNAAFARIWLFDAVRRELVLHASSGLYTHLDGRHSRIPLGELKIGRIAAHRRPHLTNDVLNDAELSDPEWARREGMVAFAGYPLLVDDRLLGVVALFSRQPFTDFTLKALVSAADGLAIGIERKQGEERLQRKLAVETTVANLSAGFLSLSNFDQAVSFALADLGRISEASRSYLFQFREQGALMDNTHEWCREGVAPEITGLQNLPSSMFPWSMQKLRAREVIQVPEVSRLPPEASAEKDILELQSIRSLLICSVYAGDELAGFIGFDHITRIGPWGDEDLFLLRLTAEVIGTALQRKRAVEALQRISAKQELILNSAGDGIYGLDAQGATTFVNPTAARILGWAAEDLIGRPMHVTLHHSKADGAPYPVEECPIDAALKDGTACSVDHEVFWRKDGSCFPVEYTSTPIHEDGTVVGAVVIFKDITERKYMETALRDSEERFRQVTEHIADVFWMTDLEKERMLYVSPGYQQIWGRSCDSLYASPKSWLDAIHPEDRERIRQAAVTQQVLGQYAEQYRIIRPDGSIRWIRDRAFPIRDASGAVYRVAGIAQDITELKRPSEG
jgi:PAS domain S-box-containing protein